MDSQRTILCNSHMNARTTLTRRRSLQVLTTSLLAPIAAARRSGATMQTPAAITKRRPESRSTTKAPITVGKENSTSIDLYYEDHGAGTPVVLIHGWPLSGAAWEKQTVALIKTGHRVIAYGRRRFGRSSIPAVGYNYDTFAADLDVVLKTLDLRDVALVGFSMGTGEVTRYIGKYGTDRVRKAVLIGTLGPYLVKAADNVEGVDPSVFEGLKNAIRADRPATVFDFLKNFYNYDVNGGTLVSDRVLEDNWNVAAGASAIGALHCVDAWVEDFRKDIEKNTVPTLIITE